jgi:GxxExxY protein
VVSKIIHKDLSYRINGICFKVHKKLGRFCREKQYSDESESLLKKGKVKYQREADIGKLYKSTKGNIADYIIEDKIELDVKAKKFITKEDYYQMNRYLKSANMKLGLIVNFRNTFLKPKRVLNSGYKDA